MRKFLCGAMAFALAAAVLTGCGRRNVSNNKDGMVTEPTATTAATMPSTDTQPSVTTQPHESTAETIHPGNGNPTDATEHTTEHNTEGTATTEATTGTEGVEGRTRHARPHIPGVVD